MADVVGKVVRAHAKAFDKERKKTFRNLLRLDLLGKERNGSLYSLKTYTSGFIPRSNTFRTGFYIEIATMDDLKLIILKTSHFALDGQCYKVEEGDVFPPSGDRFSWMVYGTFVKDVFTPTV